MYRKSTEDVQQDQQASLDVDFMRQNQLTARNEKEMMEKHRRTFTVRRSWIMDHRPTSCEVVRKYPRFVDLATLTVKKEA